MQFSPPKLRKIQNMQTPAKIAGKPQAAWKALAFAV
jgi:hypothetical protein